MEAQSWSPEIRRSSLKRVTIPAAAGGLRASERPVETPATQSMQAMMRKMEFYFREEPELDKPVLTNNCGSDVSAGAKRERLWDWNRCACHCLNIAIQAALKEEVVHECLEPLTALAARFSKSWSQWNKFKKTQMEILDREEEHNDDEGEASFDGDEDLEVRGEGEPHLKRVL